MKEPVFQFKAQIQYPKCGGDWTTVSCFVGSPQAALDWFQRLLKKYRPSRPKLRLVFVSVMLLLDIKLKFVYS